MGNEKPAEGRDSLRNCSCSSRTRGRHRCEEMWGDLGKCSQYGRVTCGLKLYRMIGYLRSLQEGGKVLSLSDENLEIGWVFWHALPSLTLSALRRKVGSLAMFGSRNGSSRIARVASATHNILRTYKFPLNLAFNTAQHSIIKYSN
jgi:hypothetical protein